MRASIFAEFSKTGLAFINFLISTYVLSAKEFGVYAVCVAIIGFCTPILTGGTSFKLLRDMSLNNESTQFALITSDISRLLLWSPLIFVALKALTDGDIGILLFVIVLDYLFPVLYQVSAARFIADSNYSSLIALNLKWFLWGRTIPILLALGLQGGFKLYLLASIAFHIFLVKEAIVQHKLLANGVVPFISWANFFPKNLHYGLNGFLIKIFDDIDKPILGILVNMELVAVYTFSQKFASIVYLSSKAVLQMGFPKMVGTIDNKTSAIRRIRTQLILVNFCTSIILFVGSVFLEHYKILNIRLNLFLLVCLMFLFCLRGFHFLYADSLTAQGEQEKRLRLIIRLSPLLVLVIFVSTSFFGLWGAVSASILAEIVLMHSFRNEAVSDK